MIRQPHKNSSERKKNFLSDAKLIIFMQIEKFIRS